MPGRRVNQQPRAVNLGRIHVHLERRAVPPAQMYVPPAQMYVPSDRRTVPPAQMYVPSERRAVPPAQIYARPGQEYGGLGHNHRTMADFLSLTEPELILFAQNFAVKLAVHDPILTSVSAADVTQAATNSTELARAINTVNNIREDAKEYSNVKDIMLRSPVGTPLPTAPTATAWPAFGLGAIAGILAWYRDIAARIKADPAYTVAIGQDLGIVGTGTVPGTDAPVLTGKALTGYQNELGWKRAGHDAVKIQSQRAGETVWTDLAVDTASPYVDTRSPLVAGTPEERRYRAAYLDNDLITTGWSDTLVVTAQG